MAVTKKQVLKKGSSVAKQGIKSGAVKKAAPKTAAKAVPKTAAKGAPKGGAKKAVSKGSTKGSRAPPLSKRLGERGVVIKGSGQYQNESLRENECNLLTTVNEELIRSTRVFADELLKECKVAAGKRTTVLNETCKVSKKKGGSGGGNMMSVWSACKDKYKAEYERYKKNNPGSPWVSFAKDKFESLSAKEQESIKKIAATKQSKKAKVSVVEEDFEDAVDEVEDGDIEVDVDEVVEEDGEAVEEDGEAVEDGEVEEDGDAVDDVVDEVEDDEPQVSDEEVEFEEEE